MTTRAIAISAAKKPNAALRISTRAARRNAVGQPMANDVTSTLERKRDGQKVRQPCAGEDQPELEVEPGRGDLAADRAKGRLDKLVDFVNFGHRQGLCLQSHGRVE